MSWTELASIAEIVGAIVVVVTLVYVAKQIRQNSHALEIAALRDTTAQWNDWSNMLASSGDLADIVVKATHDYDSLSSSEILRFGGYVQSFFDNVESSRSLVIDHRVEKDLAIVESIVARRISDPGIARWWQENTADYDDDFVAWIEGIRSKQEMNTG